MISRRQLLGASAAAIASTAAGARELPSLSAILFDRALPVLGNPAGDVTIAEFFDYACPYCKQLHPELKRIVEQDSGIRLVMKDWPINGDLVAYASRMVLAADRLGHYASAHAAVMGMTVTLSHGRIDDAMRDRGIDVAEVRDALDLHLDEIDALLSRNLKQARALSLPGTPAFIIGSKLYRRPLSPDEIRQAIGKTRGETLRGQNVDQTNP
jgi:protein-disulfide isomerase